MSDVLESVLSDLSAEGDRLEALVAPLDETGWRTATPAAGWDVATQVAHLAWTDEVATAAARDQDQWNALLTAAAQDPTGYVDACALAGGAVAPSELLSRWRDARSGLVEALRGVPAGTRMPWFGPPMSPTSMATARFMETWAHALDVAEGLGVELEPTDRIRHVAHIGVRTRDFAYAVHGRTPPATEFRVELVSPSGEVWAWGPEDSVHRISGPAYDFCRLVTQRAHPDDLALSVSGDEARAWVPIAQAFAGPPGPGRSPRG